MPREFKDIFRELIGQVTKQKRFVGRPDLLALFKERQRRIRAIADESYAPVPLAADEEEGDLEKRLPSRLVDEEDAKEAAIQAMQFFVGDNYLVLDRGDFIDQNDFQDIGHIFRNMDLEANNKPIIFPHYDNDGNYLYLVKLEKNDGAYEVHIYDARETVDEEEIEEIKNYVSEGLSAHGVKVSKADHYPSILKAEILEANPALHRLLPVIESIHSDKGNLASICGMGAVEGREEYEDFRERLNDFLNDPENRQEAVKRIIVATSMHVAMDEEYARSSSEVAERMNGWREGKFDEAHKRLQAFKDKSREELIGKNRALADGLRALPEIKDRIRDIDGRIRGYGIDDEIAELRRLAVELGNDDGSRRVSIALQIRSNKDLIRCKIAEKNYQDAGGDGAYADSDGHDAIHFARLQRDAFLLVNTAGSEGVEAYGRAVAALGELEWNGDAARQNLLMEGFEEWYQSNATIAFLEDSNERNEKGRQEIAKRLSVIELADHAFTQAKERREAWARQLSLTPDLEARDIEQTFLELEYHEFEDGGKDLVYSVFGALNGEEDLEEEADYNAVIARLDGAIDSFGEIDLPDVVSAERGRKKKIEELKQLMDLVDDESIPERWAEDYQIVRAGGVFGVKIGEQHTFIRFDNGNALLKKYNSVDSSWGEENPISQEELNALLETTKLARGQFRNDNGSDYSEVKHSDYLHGRMLKQAEMGCVDSASGMKLVKGWGGAHAVEIGEDGALRNVEGADDANHFAMVDRAGLPLVLFRRTRPDNEFEVAAPEQILELKKAATVDDITRGIEQAAQSQEYYEILNLLSGISKLSRPVALREGLEVEEVSDADGKFYVVKDGEESLGSLYLGRDGSTWAMEMEGMPCSPSDFHSAFITSLEAAPSLPAESHSHSGPHIGEALKGGKSFRLNGLRLEGEYDRDSEGRAVLTSKEFSMSRMDFGPGKQDDRYYNASFSNIVFDGPDIFNDANLWKVNFNKCKIIGGDFRRIDKRVLDSIVFKDCELVGCAFPPDFFIKESNKPGTEVVHSHLNEEVTAPGGSPKPLSYEKMMVARLRAGVAPAP